jgi:hypothetical protein
MRRDGGSGSPPVRSMRRAVHRHRGGGDRQLHGRSQGLAASVLRSSGLPLTGIPYGGSDRNRTPQGGPLWRRGLCAWGRAWSSDAARARLPIVMTRYERHVAVPHPLGVGTAAAAKRSVRALVGVGHGKNAVLRVAVFADGAHRTGGLVCLGRGTAPGNSQDEFTVPDPLVIVEPVEQVAEQPRADALDWQGRIGGHP